MTISKKLPPTEYLNECFRYDEENGILYWKERPLSHFNNNVLQYKRWNFIYSNKIAGVPDRISKNNQPVYRSVYLNNEKYREHRIIFKLCNGYDPDFIDHINGIRNDNRISNLNSVNPQENAKNRALPTNNKSGVLGVRICNRTKNYIADLGPRARTFKTFEEAVVCRKAWEKENGFHENHGRERSV